MNLVGWMVAGSLGTWAAVASVVDRATATGALAGMLAPLLATTTTWILIERVCRRDPARMSSVMIAGFVAKVLFFGAYVTIALSVLGVAPEPFAVSFTIYFVALYAVEAVSIGRLSTRAAL